MINRNTILVYALFSVALFAGTLNAAEGDTYALLAASSLRNGPDSAYAPVTALSAGDRVIEVARKGDWIKVRQASGSANGWLYTASLEPVSAIDGQMLDTAGLSAAALTPAHAVAPAIITQSTPTVDSGGQSVQQSTPVPAVADSADVSNVIYHGKDQTITATDLLDASQSQPVVAPAKQQSVSLLPTAVPTHHPQVAEAGKPAVAMPVQHDQGSTYSSTQPSSELTPVRAADPLAGDQLVPVPGEKTATMPTMLWDDAVFGQNQTEKSTQMAAANPSQDNVASSETIKAENVKPVSDKLSAPAAVETPASTNVTNSVYRFNRPSKLRAGPDSKYDIVGWGGVDSYADEIDRKGSWLKIQMQVSKRIGWVYKPSLTRVQAKVMPKEPAIAVSSDEQTLSAGEPDAKAAPAQSPVVTAMAPAAQADVAKPAESEPAMPVQAAPTAAVQPPVPAQGKKAFAKPGSVKVVPQSEHTIYRTTTIRNGPGSLSEVMGWAGAGAMVTVLAQQDEWVNVRMQESGRNGWVDVGSLQKSDPAVVVAVKQKVSAPAAETAAEKTAAGEVPPVVPEVVALKSAAPMAEPMAEAEPAAASTATAPERNLYRFTSNSTLRAGPGVNYDVVAWGKVDSYASELELKGDWVRVEMQVSKRIGWVDHSSLALAKAARNRSAPVVGAVEKAAKISPDQLYFFSQTSDLLAGPGRQFDRIGWVGRDESATIIDSKGDWRRINMTISGKRGWVPADLLKVALATGEIMIDAVKPTADAKAPAIAGFSQYQQARVVKTATLRTVPRIESGMVGWVAKGDRVSVVEKKDGWMRVNPQLVGEKSGWIRASYLTLINAPPGVLVIGDGQPASAYSDLISHGKTFNYSHAALEQALYRVPIEDIKLTIAEDDLKALFRKDIYDKSAFPVDILQDKRKLTGTIQVLGSSTRVFRKKSLRIKLDKDGGRWFGRRDIALRSMGSDKAMMREWMAWQLMEAMGMNVPDVHFTRVHFNHGEKVALYLSVEWMGKEFFASNGLDPNGEFFQPNDAAHCGDLYTADNMDICFDKISPQDGDYSSLSSMANAMNAATSENMDQVLGEYFDDETVLNWIVANALVTNGDTYNKNYWLYHQPGGGKWTMVPWDYNLTFGRTYDPYAVRPFAIFNDNFQYFYAPDVGAGNPIKDKALRNPVLRARIGAKIKHLIGLEPNGPADTFGWFSPTVMEARIGNLASVIGKEVSKDAFLFYGEEDFTKTYESLMHYTKAHDYFLKYKLFGRFDWQPDQPNPPLIDWPLPKELVGEGVIKAETSQTHMVDTGWGYFVADLNLDKPLKKDTAFKVMVEGGAKPRYLPPTRSASQCIRRSWVISAETPGADVHGDVMFEYIQENSKRTEIPQTLHEDLLELWLLDGDRWRPLKTDVNQYSNTLMARDVDVKYGEDKRFVACSPF